MSNIIEVKNLTFGYTPQDMVLRDVSFEVPSQHFLVIAGPNGAGKSTLLNLLCGALKAKSGCIRIEGSPVESFNIKALATKISVVRQEYTPAFGFSVIETVMMARTPYYRPIGFESKNDRQIVNEALESTDIVQFAYRPLANLSGGERQRVFIARALAQNTPILLLDEPTSFLDIKHQVSIYDLLKDAQTKKGRTIIAVTHDINLAAQYSDEILLLRGTPGHIGGKLEDLVQPEAGYYIGKAKDVLTPDQIEKVFGVRVLLGKVGREKFFIPLGKYAKDDKLLKKPPTVDSAEQASESP